MELGRGGGPEKVPLDRFSDSENSVLEGIECRRQPGVDDFVDIHELKVRPKPTEQALGPARSRLSTEANQLGFARPEREQHAARELAGEQQELEDILRLDLRAVRSKVCLKG